MSVIPRAKFLLVPAMPTPNGPLHLGHVSGPYLKADVMARALRRAGNDVALVSASDCWEMHVLPRAIRERRSPEEVCGTYHAEIGQCFDQMNIKFDVFFNPLEDQYREPAQTIYRSLYTELGENHPLASIIFRQERIPYSLRHAQPVLGSHIAGQCPNCGVPDLGGFYCEDCGFEISPEDIIGHWSELPDDLTQWEDYTSAFIRISDVAGFEAELQRRCTDPQFIGLAMASLAFNGSTTRLSHPACWGVLLHDHRTSPDSVFFSYPGMYALSILCGEHASQSLQVNINPFSRDSDVTLVKSFGYDNTAPYLLAATAIGLTSRNWRPFDHYLTNFFETLDGRKFSTSGQHAIWANEARRQLGTSSDTLRLYLSLNTPQYQSADFSQTAFKGFRQDWESRMHDYVRASTDAPMDRHDYQEFLAVLRNQDKHLRPATLDLRRAAECLEQWLGYCSNQLAADRAKCWSLSFAVLCYPLLPGLAKALLDRAGANNPFIANTPGDLEGIEDVRLAHNYILSTPATALINGGHLGGHDPKFI